MRALIVSDNPPLSQQVREFLLREGHDCQAGHVVAPNRAAEQTSGVNPEIIVLILAPEVDTALESLRALRTATNGRILAVGPASEPKLILRAMRDGADQYLDENDLQSELSSALTRYRAEGNSLDKAGRIIAVLAPSGGSGSSTLAVNIATLLARQHQSCALLDMKLEAGDLAALLDLKPTHNLAELCANAIRMDRVMFERSLTRHASGVCLLASPQTLADVAHVNPEGVRRTLTLARALYPYVVVDLDHSFRGEQIQVLRSADVVVLVMRLDFTSLRNTHRALQFLTELGIDRKQIQVVVNRYGQPREIPVAKAEDVLNLKIACYVCDDPKTVNRANNNGVPIVLEAPSAKVSKQLARLASGVNGQKR